MPANSIGPRIGVSGESAFKRSIREINAQLRTLDAEAKSLTATYDGQENSVEALTARQQNLTKQIEAQRRAVQEMEKFLAEHKSVLEQNTQANEKYQQNLMKARTELTKLQNQLDDTNQALDTTTRSLQAAAEGTQQAASRLNTAGNALTAGLTVPLVAAGTAAVNYASDTEESMNKVDVAFGSAAQSVKAWSETTLTSIGLARGTALDMAALYGDMATSMGYSREEAAEMSTTLVNLAADLASFKNLNIDQVNTALKSVFTGETESLKELGVVMTEANLEAYALEKGLGKTYAQMSQNEKVSLRYRYVLDQTKNAQGDFARTSDSTANQLRVLRESLKEATATLGTDLLPIVTPVISRLAELTQTFSSLDEGTRQNLVQTGLWLAMLGPAMKLTGGLTTAVNAGITAYQGLRTAQAAAAAGQLTLNAAMSANVIGLVVTAVGSLVAVLGSLAAATALAGGSTEDFGRQLESIEKSRQSAVESIEAENANTQGLIGTLESLMAVEDKSAGQKQAILGIVDQLNESVPELSLAYDEQTDSLNMTADAVRELALAEAQRAINQENQDALTEAYTTRLEAVAALNSAEADLALKEQELEEATAEITRQVNEMGAASSDAQITQQNLAAEVEALRRTIADANGDITDADALIESLSLKAEELAGAYAEAGSSAEEYTDATEDAAAVTDDLTASTEDALSVTRELTGTVDTLSKAMEEQTASGQLSVDTILDLVDAGYAAALAIDEETGAVTLNRDAYIDLAKAKIEEQITALKRAQLSAGFASAMAAEGRSAIDAARGYLRLSEAEALANKEDLGSEYAAQIAALEKLEKELDNYTVSVGSASGAGGKALTQAEKNLRAYQDIRDELDHLLAMGQITEEAYYKRLSEIRNQYLTDDENLDEYRKITEEIYKYDQELAENEDKLWAEQTNQLTEALQDRLDEIVSARDEMAEMLSGFGDLYTEADGQYSLTDLEAQTAAIERYGELLSQIEQMGAPANLMDEILGMDVKAATGYMEQLIALSGKDWNAYIAAWNAKQQAAIEVAQKFYQDELETLRTDYDQQLGDALSGMYDTAFASGEDIARSLADGIESESYAAIQAARALADSINAELSRAMGVGTVQVPVSTPAGVQTRSLDPQAIGQAYTERVVNVSSAMTVPSNTAQRQTANDAAASIINGLSTLLSRDPLDQPAEIVVNIGNETELARVLLPSLRAEERRNPEVESGV